MSGSQKKREDDEMIVLLTPEAKLKQDRLVALCPGEVFWFGFVDKMELDGWEYLRVYDIGVPKQKVSSSEVDMEGTINEFLEREVERVHELHYFAHSHGNMGVFHSGTDETQISSWARELGVPWFISHVQNKKGEMNTRFDQFKPFRISCSKVKMLGLVSLQHEKWVKEQIQEHVTQKVSTGFGYNAGASSSPSRTGPGHRQAGPRLTAQYIKGKYTTAKESFIQVVTIKGDTVRQWIMDGYILEEENARTGIVTKHRVPTMAEREERIKELAKDGLLVTKEAPDGSRSLARSTEKRVEGKATASQDDAQSQDELLQTQNQSDQKRSESDRKQSDKSSNSQRRLLPEGVDSDGVYDERTAAQLLADVDEHYGMPRDVTEEAEFLGEIETDNDDWLAHYAHWSGEFAQELSQYM